MAVDGHPYEKMNQAREKGAHHAEEASFWVDAACKAEARGGRDDDVGRCVGLSVAHSLASMAHAVGGEGIVSVEDLKR